MEIFVARQPIFDRENNIYGYELLYRNSETNAFDPSISDEQATSELLVNSYFSFGMDRLIGKNRAFINFDQKLIMKEMPALLDARKVVVELLETIQPDEALFEALRELKKKHYTLALDDYTVRYKYTEMIRLVDIIKVDFMQNTKQEIEETYRQMRKMGKILLAEKIESQEVFEWAKELGFDYFQGYFFSKPSLMKSKTIRYISPQDIAILKEMSSKVPDFKKIALIIEREPITAYKLLRLVNANFTKSYRISSVLQALVLLGVDTLRKWFTLIMVQKLAQDQPKELIKISMQRAKFFELLGEKNEELREKSVNKANYPVKDKNEMMLVGVLSIMDVILGRTMDEIVKELPVSDNIINTLLMKKGSPYLDDFKVLLAYERGDFENEEVKKHEEYNLSEIYFKAVEWSEKMIILN